MKSPALLLLAIISAQAQTDWPQLQLTPLGSGAVFPVQVTQPQDGTGRFFVVEQQGKIQVYQPGSSTPEMFLDITDRVLFLFGGEEGLLSMVFPPDFATKKYFYVYYTGVDHYLSRFRVSSTNSNRADPASEELVLNLPRHETTVNSGQLLFGADGYLYVGVGDHGFSESLGSSAQDPQSWFGKILRLDVESSTNAYQIPPNNPFVQNTNYLPEIWALGLRNPFRFSFDRATGDLFIGDVGQLTWEELSHRAAASPGGANFGWPIREGKHPYQFGLPAPGTSLTDPIFETAHEGALSAIIGGFVYRGPNSNRMNGLYFFSDFYTGQVRAAKRNGSTWEVETVAETGRLISSFGEDQAGRLYVTDYLSGEFLRLDDNGEAAQPRFNPSDTVIFTDQVTLSCLSTGATLHYTLDGTDPDQTHPSVLSGETVMVLNGSTLKARAFRGNLLPSAISSATYTLRAATPTFTPSQGPIPSGSSIALQSRTPGAAIRFTLNGTDPGPGSTLYVAPIPFGAGLILKARSFKTGFDPSAAATFSETPLKFDPIQIVGFYGTTALRWPSEVGKTYQLEFTDDLVQWFKLTAPIPGTGGQLSHTNIPALPLRSHRHFRVECFQP